MGFDFNAENFGVGVLAGWASAYGIYRARNFLGAVRRSVSEQATSAQISATRTADTRYIGDLTAQCETTHLAGNLVHLSQIVVEPRFIPAPELIAPPDDDVQQEVFYVVSQVPDFPYLHAPYNIETLSIEDLGKGDRTIALLGLPGSGRTTALLTIALWGMGKVKFEQPKDAVQLMLEKEEASLSNEDRSKRAKERLMIEERAKERLAEEKGDGFDAEAAEKAGLPMFQRLMPIYVHLANVNIGSGEFGKNADPAEPLVRALQFQMGRVTAKTLPRNVYNRLNKGQALVLIDGFDDLPENERQAKLAWIEAFINEYRRNFIIVAGPAHGYGHLTGMGLTPVFMRPWSDLDAHNAADKWSQAWSAGSGKRRRSSNVGVSEELVAQAKTDTRALSPFDLTLKIWGTYANAEEDFENWLRGFITRTLSQKEVSSDLWHQLSLAASLQLDDGYVTQSRLESLLLGQTPPPAATEGNDTDSQGMSESEDSDDVFASSAEDESDDLDQLFQETDEKILPSAPPTPEPTKAPANKKEAAKINKDVTTLLAMLKRSGLLVLYRGGRYQFRHPFVASYLASLTLKRAPQSHIAQKGFEPEWSQAIGYAALHTSIEAAVNARMNTPADVLHNHLLEITHWMTHAGQKAEWRANILRQVGNLLVSPHQYTVIRERLAAGLIGTRDNGVLRVFRVLARNPNADLRRLGTLGMGALGYPEAIEDLASLLADKVNEVQLAAAMALGAIGTQDALELMAQALTTGTEQLRRAVSESFAAIPEEGYPVLYDAINDEDMMLRRAAIYGLRRIKTPWAISAIYRTFLSDQQWYVRSAAQAAFEDVLVGSNGGPKGYPPAEAVPWLRTWLTNLGESAPRDQSPEDLLVSALQDEDPLVRALSAATLGQLGVASKASALYAALYDQEEVVRDTAHRALADLEMQMGYKLPAPA